MQRIIDPTASATLPAPPALTGSAGYFTGGVPGVLAATRVRYWFLNMIQEELMSVLAAAGVAADTTGTSFGQLLASIEVLIGAVPHGIAVFSSSGTFTVPSGVTVIQSGEVYGGGGGGGASSATVSTTASCGSGGSSGAYARKQLTGLTPGATIAITVGSGGAGATTPGANGNAGGASSIGSYVSAAGGGGGQGCAAYPPPMINGPNAVQTFGTGGDINGGSVAGGWGQSALINNSASGKGGGNLLGDGANAIPHNLPGVAATVPGTGGSGGCTDGASGAAKNGGSGAGGLVILRW